MTCPNFVFVLNQGSKTYLASVKENDYFQPWRTSVPHKRVSSAPKTYHEYVTTGESINGELNWKVYYYCFIVLLKWPHNYIEKCVQIIFFGET